MQNINNRVIKEYAEYYNKNNLTNQITKLKEDISNAISDIRCYNEALNLKNHILNFKQKMGKHNKVTDLAPGMKETKQKKLKQKEAPVVLFDKVVERYDSEKTKSCYCPYFYWANGKWYLRGIHYENKYYQSFSEEEILETGIGGKWKIYIHDDFIGDDAMLTDYDTCKPVIELFRGLIAPITK